MSIVRRHWEGNPLWENKKNVSKNEGGKTFLRTANDKKICTLFFTVCVFISSVHFYFFHTQWKDPQSDVKEKNYLYFRVIWSSKTNPSHLKLCPRLPWHALNVVINGRLKTPQALRQTVPGRWTTLTEAASAMAAWRNCLLNWECLALTCI